MHFRVGGAVVLQSCNAVVSGLGGNQQMVWERCSLTPSSLSGPNVCLLPAQDYVARWIRWLGGLLVDTRFDSRPGRCHVRTLGKFLTPMCNVVLYNNII